MELPRRGMIIHFMDGSKKMLEFPQQIPDANAASMPKRIKDALESRHLVLEAEGALLVIPFENIKYIQVHPAPKALPQGVIRGASFRD